MPRFFFDVVSGHGVTPDEEGLELEGQAAAVQIAIESIRSMVAEDARSGVLDLKGRVEVKDEESNMLITVAFAEAFRIAMPSRDNSST